MSNNRVLVVGTGPMAAAHAQALTQLGKSPEVVGRNRESAERFLRRFRVPVHTTDLGDYFQCGPLPDHAIIAIPIVGLGAVATAVLEAGFKEVLIEKPGSLSSVELKRLQKVAEDLGANVSVAYNRRFLESTSFLLDMLKTYSEPFEIQCEFNERLEELKGLNHPPKVLERWLIANSSHVLDLAIFLGGYPTLDSNKPSGSLKWHPSSSKFSASGTTVRGTGIRFLADWNHEGSWSLRILAGGKVFEMRPLEEVYELDPQSSSRRRIFTPSPKTRTKPGLLEQAEEFLGEKRERLCSLSEQIRNMQLYEAIGGYPVQD